ncbi:MAG: 30S ribosomal protein S18 [Clostridiales bacterium]|jgi:small subunit ribosomal protein S18|nr:30S ribosomal protein S18 [Clostridiales bacterium]
MPKPGGGSGRRDNNRSGGYREQFDKSDNPRQRRAKRKICAFCVDKVTDIDYKEAIKLKKYISERAKILPRRVSGCCAKHQRQLTVAIKRARHIALLPYTAD